ncbi:HAMP domain-containing histidine kinase [Paenibacillus athensensis]|uniref:histidine kinase n=1 Tax=Paenibacillus athensensis TaxID=1967502 RepID=A0A4Y8PVB2_9BACL|nr:HAMP domain-containing sensor histidine kinase [Paenibacillus athensensis]MCD1261706.1 HAMP domain-containing histidine kinase [Paenibacillus athensensis]
MSKLARKLMMRITAALCLVFVLSYGVNTYLLPKYMLQQTKSKLAALTAELAPLSQTLVMARIAELEAEEPLAAAYAPLVRSVAELNAELLRQWKHEGIALNSFELTLDQVELLRTGARFHQMYDQNKLKASFLVHFFAADGYVFAVGESIAYSSELLRTVNRFNLYIWIGMLAGLLLLAALYAMRIVDPLAQLDRTAEAISRLSFVKPDIRTGDEIESLAHSLGRMSDKLKEAHQELEVKNANLRRFISEISHELKTPLSLIQVYAAGLLDGRDDGTYAEAIRQQSAEMSGLLDRLLELSRKQTEAYAWSAVALCPLLAELLGTYKAAAGQQGLAWEADDRMMREEAVVLADRDKLASVLRNLMSNALKYTSDARVSVTLETKDGRFHFRIANGTEISDARRWENVWAPFYVMENTRSQRFSGTGLGLSIVAVILDKHQASYGYELGQGTVTFYFTLPLLGPEWLEGKECE